MKPLPVDHTDIAKALSATEALQAAASDPKSSAWVTANAGTGKTYVLVRRVLRLLLSGTAPERILCLTYTKAAAAEMSKRVFDELAKWVTKSDDDLKEQLHKVLDRPPSEAELALSRTLFTTAIETPGGFKVQTIHAFAERLLQRFPLEAGVPAGFSILDDIKGRELKADAIEGTLKAATSGRNDRLARALDQVIRFAADATFDTLISNAMAKRDVLEAMIRRDDANGRTDFSLASEVLRKVFGLDRADTEDSIIAAQANVLDDATLRELAELLASGSANDRKREEKIRSALSAQSNESRASYLLQAFLKKDQNDVPKDILTKALREKSPELNATADRAKTDLLALNAKLKSLIVVDATLALYRLASDAIQRYRDNKAIAGTLDFDDLIRATRNLLSATESAQWVLYKLDGGLDHILVDEAQDTSPEQWDIVESLASEVFSGVGAHDDDRQGNRTVFAVGDEKQSIYSFQGAAPHMFADVGKRFSDRAHDAGARMQPISLGMSFRTVAPVLDAVDRTFNGSSAGSGVLRDSAHIKHIAFRTGQAGLVEIWPPEFAPEQPEANVWQPLDVTKDSAPVHRLASRIATRIRHWLDNGEILKSQNRPIRAGDIFILVRKRNPFARPMVAALKRLNIPVAGADRIRLTEQIAVQDLVALGDFLTLPEDDLALATILKGPLFGLSDDDLLGFAPGRKSAALWKALLAIEKPSDTVAAAIATLKKWRKRADFIPPFEFFSEVLDRDQGRSRLLHRLGPEATDAIDEFLDQALQYDDASAPSLTGFLAALRADETDVQRDIDLTRDEVRVMTVHGAKGLEAPIVFLPDTCSITKGVTPGGRLMTLENNAALAGSEVPFIWPVKSSSWLPPIAAANQIEQQADEEERNRLLYVAMTRARDRLYVAGFCNAKKLPDTCWYSAISSALVGDSQPITLSDGEPGWRLETDQSVETETDTRDARTIIAADQLPDFALRPAPSEPQLLVPLAPSRLEPYGMNDEGEPNDDDRPHDPAIVADHLSPTELTDARRFLRGTLTHALLQHLPAITPTDRRRVAETFVSKRGEVLHKSVRASIVTETLAVLDDPSFAPLFATDSRAEVSIAAEIPRPTGINTPKGPALKLSGQIDRLAINGNDVLIVDYKTNRPPPLEVNAVADAYLFQLAAYVLALRQMYPDKTVRTALLWTDGPRLMPIPEDVIEKAITRLWSRDLAHLDAV